MICSTTTATTSRTRLPSSWWVAAFPSTLLTSPARSWPPPWVRCWPRCCSRWRPAAPRYPSLTTAPHQQQLAKQQQRQQQRKTVKSNRRTKNPCNFIDTDVFLFSNNSKVSSRQLHYLRSATQQYGKLQRELPGSILLLGGSILELLSSSLPLGGSRLELLSGKVKT